MDNKTIQEERVRRYFIDSAKSIIRGEGVAALSARNVANEAGYSAATLYNYFKDINSLMKICLGEFFDEVNEFVESQTKSSKEPRQMVIDKSWAFAKYFIQYPGIYELLFLEKIRVIGTTPELTIKTEEISIQSLTKEFELIFQGKQLTEATLLKQMYSSMIHGFLLMYLNKRIPDDFMEFKNRFNQSIEKFLDMSW